MKIYNFDLLAYPHVPSDAPRTPVPSSYFDPVKGAQNYKEHLNEMAHCEELGFDGVVFNEHHYSAYGTMPSPNLIAAALSQRTTRIKIGVLGAILPLRYHPVRVAEEYAMIDCLSGGRLIAGFVRGIPAEYVWYGVNPEESRGRFEEAYQLIVTAWSQPLWSHEGKFFQLKDCAIWPRPLQQPHPPVWIAARSAESVEWCVKRRLPIAQVYQTTGQIEDTFNYFREGNRQRVDFSKLDWEGLISTGYVIAGSPDTVARQILDQMKQIGAGHFMGMFHIGNLAHERVVSSLNLFHKEIMPRLR